MMNHEMMHSDIIKCIRQEVTGERNHAPQPAAQGR